MEDIVYIHGKTMAKIITQYNNAALVEYLEDSMRVKKGNQKRIRNSNIRKERQTFGKHNRLVKA